MEHVSESEAVQMLCYTTLAICLHFGSAKSISVEEFEKYVETI